MTIPDAIQLGALGILGVIVISGMSLFKWAVQKWLPSYVNTLKECSRDICAALDKLSDRTSDLKKEVLMHDEGTSRFDTNVSDIMSMLNTVSAEQRSHSLMLDRLTVLNETLVKDVLERQTVVFEQILKHLNGDAGKTD